jgi:hypothetical protein
LALLKIDSVDKSIFNFLPLKSDTNILVGDVVLAIGNPFGIGNTVTLGIVSAMANKNNFISSVGHLIQTDAAVNPGNSGGALVDTSGKLVGINSAIYNKNGIMNNGIGFAIPVEVVKLFGKENLFHINRNEMYHMNSNVFSIAPNVVISEQKFDRLNTWLREKGFTVEEIPYAEIAKQEGLLRCSTLPLIRD